MSKLNKLTREAIKANASKKKIRRSIRAWKRSNTRCRTWYKASNYTTPWITSFER